MLEIRENRLVYQYDAEKVWIEAWGENALRIRATKEAQMPMEDWALSAKGSDQVKLERRKEGAVIGNGKIRAEVSERGSSVSITAAENFFLRSTAGIEGICWTENAVRWKWKRENSVRFPEEIII